MRIPPASFLRVFIQSALWGIRERNYISVIFTIQRGRRLFKFAALLPSALLSCAFAASAQNRPQQIAPTHFAPSHFPENSPPQKLSPAFQDFMKRQSAPFFARFNFATPRVHRVHTTADGTMPNDPFIQFVNGITVQWGPRITATNFAWHIWQPKNTRPIVIAIVDTGVDDTHPDLTNVMLRDANGVVIGYNIITKTAGPTIDDETHGTHCAGIAAAQGNNGIGIIGMAGWNGDPNSSDTSYVKIMPVKVLDASGSGTDQDVADGVDWAVAHGANIISLSLGDPMPSDPMANSIAKAWAAGCLVVCAAGNAGNTNYFYPAASPYAISVAGTGYTMDSHIEAWSTRGPWVNLAAPGSEIYSTLPGNRYGPKTGTSMACPHVAGLAALVWAQNPTLKNSDVYNAIFAGVDPYPAASNQIAPGSGRINSFTTLTAVNAAMGSVNGSVTLEGCVNANQTVNLRFRSTDGLLDFTNPVTLTANAGADTGTFTVSNIPAATYTVSVKGAKWLQKNVAVTVSNSPAVASPLTVALSAGDANNDNSVDSTDFGILISAFNSSASVPGSGYDASVDFNCDGLVDAIDFGLLIGEFNQQGDK